MIDVEAGLLLINQRLEALENVAQLNVANINRAMSAIASLHSVVESVSLLGRLVEVNTTAIAAIRASIGTSGSPHSHPDKDWIEVELKKLMVAPPAHHHPDYATIIQSVSDANEANRKKIDEVVRMVSVNFEIVESNFEKTDANLVKAISSLSASMDESERKLKGKIVELFSVFQALSLDVGTIDRDVQKHGKDTIRLESAIREVDTALKRLDKETEKAIGESIVSAMDSVEARVDEVIRMRVLSLEGEVGKARSAAVAAGDYAGEVDKRLDAIASVLSEMNEEVERIKTDETAVKVEEIERRLPNITSAAYNLRQDFDKLEKSVNRLKGRKGVDTD